MASQTPGIQQLLTAEKKASEKVAEARKRKTKRLKAAKEEAKVDIENFRGQVEQKFKDRESKILGSRDDVRMQMDQRQEDELRSLNAQTQQNKDKVIERVLELVCHVKPELHVNYRPT
ncbi:V-type proton ATPase subunit G-like [Clavelina lepadiformis]|uniref:V-type proton ATPase subunit G-like n=1 Tax=Clavelina lepadiformis TaxID=159417 RepID=UPI004041CCD3